MSDELTAAYMYGREDGKRMTDEKVSQLTIERDRPDRYARLVFTDEDERVMMLTAHKKTNDGKYAHNHASLYLLNHERKLKGNIDWTFGHERNQMQMENMDIVAKSSSDMVIRGNDGEYYALRVDASGKLYAAPKREGYIQSANVPVVDDE